MENKWVGQARMKETIEKKEPNFEGYQMIGDSQLRRFGEKIMNLRGEYREKGGKRINSCIGGQTIEQLTRELKHANNLEKQLIVMIGTNDLLRDKEVKNICNDYDKLVEVLLEKADKIILVTIPPIPKLGENDRYHLNKLERINEHIKSKENNEKVTVLEVAEKYYDNYDSTDCNVKLYEKEIFYKGKWCEDLIHLNKEGLTILANELGNLIRSDKKKSGLRLGVNTAFIPENDIFDELTNEDNYNKIPIKPVAEALPEILGKINKEEYHMIIDSGSQATIMSEKYYNEIKERSVLEILELPVTNLSIIGVTGIRSKKIDKQVMIENKLFQINFLVVKAVNLGIILGCDFFREHNAKIDFEHDEPGCIKNYEAKLNITNEKPFVGRSYPIPYSKREGVRKEIENMLKGDIIEESDSPYSNPLVKLRHLNIRGELADCDVNESADCDVNADLNERGDEYCFESVSVVLYGDSLFFHQTRSKEVVLVLLG
ncbi:hypothetical protein J6590_030902 [Homalodisca vitripennis]|nr:hypothetical protein J6590_030902 [Homalodisca vitripennis]